MREELLVDNCSAQDANHEVERRLSANGNWTKKRDEFSKGGKWRRERFVLQLGSEEKASAEEVGNVKRLDRCGLVGLTPGRPC
jgi:hypothetical protein